MRSDDGNEVFFSACKKQYRLVKWEGVLQVETLV